MKKPSARKPTKARPTKATARRRNPIPSGRLAAADKRAIADQRAAERAEKRAAARAERISALDRQAIADQRAAERSEKRAAARRVAKIRAGNVHGVPPGVARALVAVGKRIGTVEIRARPDDSRGAWLAIATITPRGTIGYAELQRVAEKVAADDAIARGFGKRRVVHLIVGYSDPDSTRRPDWQEASLGSPTTWQAAWDRASNESGDSSSIPDLAERYGKSTIRYMEIVVGDDDWFQ